jgi:hypothetical protein
MAAPIADSVLSAANELVAVEWYGTASSVVGSAMGTCAREGGWSGSGAAAHAIDQRLPRQSISNAELIQDFGIHRVRE